MTKAEEAVREKGIDATMIKVEDIQEIMEYNVLSTPVLVIDEGIKIKGRVATVEEIKSLITT